MQNALNSAFNDYRFSPLIQKELPEIKIEISVLTLSKILIHKNPQELLKKINNKIGIILTFRRNSATLLPQVWKQIPDKTYFLEHLSRKAGLGKDARKNPLQK